MKMSNKVFDILRFLAEVAIDAVGIAYFGLAEVWNLPYGEQVKTTCIILSVLLGTLIGIKRMQYKGGNDIE